MEKMRKMRGGPKSNARRGATDGSSGKHKRKDVGGGSGSGSGGGGGRKPIKVVYISNPVRVSTSEAGFRALVQELTGRDADPSKYSGGTGAGAGAFDVGESSGGSPAGPLLGAALPSPGASTEESSDAAATTAGSHVPTEAAHGHDYDYYDDEESFPPLLIDNRYSVFSPPTFLYGSSSHNEA